MSNPQSSNPETFQNEDISVVATRHPNCRIKFEISVKPHAVIASYAKAIKNVSKEVSLPGFRKGKAPERLILEKFKGDIQKEWIDVTLQTSFSEAVQLTKLFPMRDGQMQRPVLKECSQEKGAQFSIEFESQPEIPNVNLETVKIAKVHAEPVSEEQKEKIFEQAQRQFMEFKPVKNRGVKKGDYIDLDLDVFDSPQGEPRKVANNQRVEVTSEALPVWVFEKLLHVKEGETIEGETEAGPNPDPNFVSRPFKATVKAIWHGELPEMNEEVAKKLGATSVEDLKIKIAERLEREAHEEARRKQLEALDDFLLTQYAFDLPNSLIERNAQPRIQNFRQQIQEQKAPAPADQGKIEEAIKNGVVRGLTLHLLIRKLAVDNQIELTEADLQEEFKHQVYLASIGRQTANIFGDKEHLQEQLYNLALDRKVKELLLEKTKNED